jgi:hypothetical protein
LSPLHTGSKPLFFFFSNRLGCFGSIALSVVVTLILLVLFGWISL